MRKIDITKPRWRGAYHYIDTLPLHEKRCFFARATKFFLEQSEWDSELRPPIEEHINMRHMVLAFNDHKQDVMINRKSKDVVYQWQIVRYIKKGKKRRQRKKQISRLTYEMMQIIRLCHPVRGLNKDSVKDRVRYMSNFQKEVKKKYFDK